MVSVRRGPVMSTKVAAGATLCPQALAAVRGANSIFEGRESGWSGRGRWLRGARVGLQIERVLQHVSEWCEGWAGST
jgi:hypothetical protein